MRVDDFSFDDQNEEEMGRHGVTPRQVLQVLDGPHRIFRNKGGEGRASYVMIGPTTGGTLLTIPIDPTYPRGVWRPRTAYESSPAEKARYRR